jgi:hypothetical protein
MDIMVSETLTAPQLIEAAVVLTLKVAPNVSREDLEKATLHVEGILDKHASQIARGASACADFERESIEIDLVLTGGSPAELHQQLAIVIGTLEENCTLHLRGNNENQLVLTSSTTHFAQPHTLAA